jgi:hypothetical protein
MQQFPLPGVFISACKYVLNRQYCLAEIDFSQPGTVRDFAGAAKKQHRRG